MAIGHGEKAWTIRQRAGFTTLELTVVVVVISILFLFAYQRYLDLLVDVEKASMEQTVGILRSAVGLKVAKMIVGGKTTQIKKYAGTNPVEFLAELPKNYVGEDVSLITMKQETGIWYFDKRHGELVYNVKNKSAFFSEDSGSNKARYKMVVLYDKDNRKDFAGLSLRSVTKYSWFKKKF